MLHSKRVLGQLEYELMLLARYALRPQHRNEEVLDRSAMVLLSRLENVAPMTLKELSRALRLDVSTVHRQSAALLRAGMLDYAPRDSGEVARRLTHTEAGLVALAHTRTIYERGLESVVKDWPEEQRVELATMLRSFNQDVERIEGALWPRSPAEAE